jgi:MGT family glycosyltransferase
MSKVIFFNVPAHGHTNPTLALVEELVNRGEEVIYYSFDEFKIKIEQTGAKYRNYNVDISQFVNSNLTSFPLLFKTIMEVSQLILYNLLDEIKMEHPDYIIHDSLCCWGKSIAAILNIPSVSSITTFVFNKESLKGTNGIVTAFLDFYLFGIKDLLRGFAIQKKIAKEYLVENHGLLDTFINKERLNIVYTSQDFQPNSRLFDNSFKFLGPSIIERKEKNDITLPESNALPVIYISLGTVVNFNIDFYNSCFQALSDMKILVVLSVGNRMELSNFKNAPSNFIIRNYVSQLKILSKSDCFITHGGMNSVHEGLFFGVHLIVVPQHKEQEIVAERVEATNAGIYLRKVNSKSIKESVVKILKNNIYKLNSIKIRESFISSGGFSKAADEILLFKQSFQLRNH